MKAFGTYVIAAVFSAHTPSVTHSVLAIATALRRLLSRLVIARPAARPIRSYSGKSQ